jgi:ubiquinone/menaquinone biosynthesis C-methylase UbiE
VQPGVLAERRGVRFVSDIGYMGIRDGAFDAIFCIHVLEHALEDRLALAEIRRILKPGGTAIIMVPAHLGPETHEWGRPDPLFCYHVRDYSVHDFRRRLGGFRVEEITPSGLLDADGRERFQLHDSVIVYCCTKSDSLA